MPLIVCELSYSEDFFDGIFMCGTGLAVFPVLLLLCQMLYVPQLLKDAPLALDAETV